MEFSTKIIIWRKTCIRWFKVNFLSPDWKRKYINGSLNHPTKVTKTWQVIEYWRKWIFSKFDFLNYKICQYRFYCLNGPSKEYVPRFYSVNYPLIQVNWIYSLNHIIISMLIRGISEYLLNISIHKCWGMYRVWSTYPPQGTPPKNKAIYKGLMIRWFQITQALSKPYFWAGYVITPINCIWNG